MTMKGCGTVCGCKDSWSDSALSYISSDEHENYFTHHHRNSIGRIRMSDTDLLTKKYQLKEQQQPKPQPT